MIPVGFALVMTSMSNSTSGLEDIVGRFLLGGEEIGASSAYEPRKKGSSSLWTFSSSSIRPSCCSLNYFRAYFIFPRTCLP